MFVFVFHFILLLLGYGMPYPLLLFGTGRALSLQNNYRNFNVTIVTTANNTATIQNLETIFAS